MSQPNSTVTICCTIVGLVLVNPSEPGSVLMLAISIGIIAGILILQQAIVTAPCSNHLSLSPWAHLLYPESEDEQIEPRHHNPPLLKPHKLNQTDS